MYGLTIESYDQADLQDILKCDERLLWCGRPAYGRKFFQMTKTERVYAVAMSVGAAVMWATWPLIDDRATTAAFWIYLIFSVCFVLFLFALANLRQIVLNHLVNYVTDTRAIVCRRGGNWRFATRLYVVSCPHSDGYPYTMTDSRPVPSLQVGTLLSQDQLQPIGLALAHPGQPVLWGRITSPVMFEYIPDAKEVLQMIRTCVAASVMDPRS